MKRKSYKSRNRRTKYGYIADLMGRIVSSGEACVEVKNYEHKTANGCATSLRNRIRMDHLNQLQVVVRGKRVFVINTLHVKEVW